MPVTVVKLELSYFTGIIINWYKPTGKQFCCIFKNQAGVIASYFVFPRKLPENQARKIIENIKEKNTICTKNS